MSEEFTKEYKNDMRLIDYTLVSFVLGIFTVALYVTWTVHDTEIRKLELAKINCPEVRL